MRLVGIALIGFGAGFSVFGLWTLFRRRSDVSENDAGKRLHAGMLALIAGLAILAAGLALILFS